MLTGIIINVWVAIVNWTGWRTTWIPPSRQLTVSTAQRQTNQNRKTFRFFFYSTEDITIIFHQPDQSQVLSCSRQRGITVPSEVVSGELMQELSGFEPVNIRLGIIWIHAVFSLGCCGSSHQVCIQFAKLPGLIYNYVSFCPSTYIDFLSSLLTATNHAATPKTWDLNKELRYWLQINASIQYIDFEGRTDGESIYKLMTGLRPRRVILVGTVLISGSSRSGSSIILVGMVFIPDGSGRNCSNSDRNRANFWVSFYSGRKVWGYSDRNSSSSSSSGWKIIILVETVQLTILILVAQMKQF